MIVRLFNKPHVIYQSGDSDGDMANEALGVCVDNGGAIIIRQAGSEIVLNVFTVAELCNLLTKLAKEESSAEG